MKTSTKLRISDEKLKNNFQKHFAAREIPLPPELEKPEEYAYLKEELIPINEEVPSEIELRTVLKSFKNNKSSGTDRLRTEGLKYNNSQQLINVLITLFTLIWACIQVPVSWLHASITCLYKKGSMSEAKNYRGLSIGANLSRILSKIVMMRIQEAYEKYMGNEQFGFRRNRSTADGIFIVKQIIDKYEETLIAVYIDLTAAYDHIPRNLLFRVLTLRTGATHLLAIMEKMYEATTASIRGMQSKFDVLVGCRQGGQESPCFFNLYFDYVLKIAAHAIDQEFPEGWGIEFNYQISHLCTNRDQRQESPMRGIDIIQWILYADDAVLFCKTVKEAERLLSIINETCLRFGLNISFAKTKTQVFHNNELAEKPTLFNIGDEVIENVKTFIYLGHQITTEINKTFTEHRIACAFAKFNELRGVLSDINVNVRSRRKILESCVRMRLTYGTQAWFPKEQELQRLESCWHEILRSMVKGGWSRRKPPDNSDETVYAFKYNNQQIEQILKTSPLRDAIYQQHLRYIGHVCRMPNNSIPKCLLFAQPQRSHYRDPWIKIAELLNLTTTQAKRLTQSRKDYHGLLQQCFSPTS